MMLSAPISANPSPRTYEPAKVAPVKNSVGIACRSFQVMAIGRSPMWLTYVVGPRKTYGAVSYSPLGSIRQNSSTVLVPVR
jgi:hypothetical protein